MDERKPMIEVENTRRGWGTPHTPNIFNKENVLLSKFKRLSMDDQDEVLNYLDGLKDS
jgi:hypothetical protein